MLAVLVSAEDGNQAHRAGEVAWREQRGVAAWSVRKCSSMSVNISLRVELRHLASEQRHEHLTAWMVRARWSRSAL